MPTINTDNETGIYLEANIDNSPSSNNTTTSKSAKAKEEKKIDRATARVSKKLDLLDKKMDSLYSDIYISRPDNRNNLKNITDRLDDSINRLQDNSVSISMMGELLRRIQTKENGAKSSTKDLAAEVDDLFSDQNVVNTIFMNEDLHRYISSQNAQYDLICKYLPKLEEALMIRRDNVLCSDNFSKKFLNPKSIRTSKQEVEIFAANAKRLENTYNISEFFEKVYWDTSKYGEAFVYRVPYKLAFQRLLRRYNYNRQNNKLGQISFGENTTINGRSIVRTTNEVVTCVNESYISSDEYKNYLNSVKSSYIIDEDSSSKFSGYAVNIHFNDTSIPLELVNNYTILESKQDIKAATSLFSEFKSIQEANNSNGENSKLNSLFTSEVKKRDKLTAASITNDGLIIPAELDRNPDKIEDFTGVVLEQIDRENIVPVYIGEKCLGYYYMEFKDEASRCGYCGGIHATPGISNAQNYAYNMTTDQQDLAIRFIASKISASIDTHFINANKDLKEEIYAILKYNEKFDLSRVNDIAVSFIPADDIVHCYFEMDKHTHRGISDLHRSLVPAMLYILLYLTDIIGKITRSTDKRIYYVKQTVEQNVARTMMNVVQQVKKGNLGMRQIESMNNILNIIGKYNDYIVPVGPSGDYPIQFETMQGQNIETPNDIMEKMEEAAVNPVCPLELINSYMQQDFATRFSMSSTRFLKLIYARQRICEKFFSKIYTPVYNYEFNENYNVIEIQLPPPVYLTVTNAQQMLDQVNQLVDKINDSELGNEEDEVKSEFKKLYIRQTLNTYIDYDLISQLIETAKINVESRKQPAVNDGGNSDTYTGEDEGL